MVLAFLFFAEALPWMMGLKCLYSSIAATELMPLNQVEGQNPKVASVNTLEIRGLTSVHMATK